MGPSPQAAEPPATFSFQPMEFSYGQVLAKGGLNNKPSPMVTRREYVGEEQFIFAKLAVNEPWLCKSVCGTTSASNGGIGRTRLLKQLHELVEKACDGLLESKGQDEVNEDDMNDPTNEVDPMNEVDGGDEMMSTPVKTRGRGVKRKRNVGKGERFVAELPETCRELYPKCNKMRSVPLFL